MKYFRWLWVVPLLIGAMAAAYFGWWHSENPILYLRMDAGTFSAFIGILLAGLSLGLYWWSTWKGRFKDRIESSTRHDVDRARRRFLQRLDHELKNPLTAIRATSANLSAAGEEGRLDQALVGLNTQIDRIVRLTNDLRKVADLPTVPLELQSVDMPELLQDVVAAMEAHPAAVDRHISLVTPQAPWPTPPIQADRDLLYLALFNLVDNSLKYSQPGDTVEIRLKEEGGDWVTVEVADTGCGIPEAEQTEVWHELFRGSQSYRVEGSGLGLSLVKAVVERHRGRVHLRSRSQQGTVVTLALPIEALSRFEA